MAVCVWGGGGEMRDSGVKWLCVCGGGGGGVDADNKRFYWTILWGGLHYGVDYIVGCGLFILTAQLGNHH